MEKPLKQLSSQDWETLIDDFQFGSPRQERWTSLYSGLALLDLALPSLLRKDFPLKLQLIIFLDEFSDVLIRESEVEVGFGRIIEAVRAVIQAPVDGISITYTLKEQMLVSATSIAICVDLFRNSIRHLENLTELLLTIVNRPNHGLDRQTRAVACECLRELEKACPCLLAEVAGHIWNLCQSERTHASQSYILLLMSVIHDLALSKTNVSIFTTSVPLVPFNVPHTLIAASDLASSSNKELSVSNLRELRRVMAFLLERPQILTPCAMIEFMSKLVPLVLALELQASLLKVQFSGLLYSYDPMLCHVVLTLYSRFPDAFDGHDDEIARRLMLISKEVRHHLVFRLLGLHWLLGFSGLPSKKEATKKNSIVQMALSFYPTVFDPLALKSLKLDMLAYSSTCLEKLRRESEGGTSGEEMAAGVSVVKLFEDALVSLSAFKWLPPWSTETAVAFHIFHKFLIGATTHSNDDALGMEIILDSTIFHTLQRLLVDIALEYRGLIPVIVSFIDRLLGCCSHCWLGERLLQTFNENLIPRIIVDYQASYFPIFNRIAENDTIPPSGLLELLLRFIVALVEKHGPETGLKSWLQGSKVLGICQTLLMHHHSSRVFLGLSRLLAFTCMYFPDLEVRDNARTYLRMLMCIPGKKLRHILNLGDQLPAISPTAQFSSFFHVQSPRSSHDPRRSSNLSSYVHLERTIPLLVKQSWVLSISSLDIGSDRTSYLVGIRDSESPLDMEREVDDNSSVQIVSEIERIDQVQEPLRVMDSKFSEIVKMLRKYFSCIPDFRHTPGLKIRIPCNMRFESGPFNRIWGVGSSNNNLDGVDALPAMYATRLTFSSSSPYGSIPSGHIPFLLGEPPKNDGVSRKIDCLDIVPAENGSVGVDNFRVDVMIELEPREPMPGLVDVTIEANAENGQIICGHLNSITVGIEDMFLKASVPSDIQKDEVPGYYLELFGALWEACGNSSNTGRETFPLSGGKGVVAISGTRSVKLLEVSAVSMVQAVERYLALYVVSVLGGPLIDMVRNGGVIKDIVWNDVALDSLSDATSLITDSDRGLLQIKYIDDENNREIPVDISKRNMGCFLILIFLPPRFHLLFQMEVSDYSTLVRIRTDHWPCLAYIDDYLEALFLT